MSLFKISLFSFFLTMAGSSQVLAAACCGGGFALPSVITGDDAALITGSWSQAQIESDVRADGVWQHRSDKDQTQVLRIDGAHIFWDRYQAGFSLPVQTRERSGEQGGKSSGLGDITLQTGYEYLPDWDYHPWRPKGIGFLTLTLPTGKSIYESDTSTGLDTGGRGFWSLGVGTILTKIFGSWDVNATVEGHHSFEKQVHNSQFDGRIQPGNGASWGVGSGYNLKNLRLGGALTWNYEDPIRASGSVDADGSVQRFTTGTLSASYLIMDSWAATFSYSDQLLFGDPVNASLSRSVALLVQKRWAR
jgi:hypothetical protein